MLFEVSNSQLEAGIDIPFWPARLIMKQPTWEAIAAIGENDFWRGCQVFNFSKDMLQIQDKGIEEEISDFEIFMLMMTDKKNSNIIEYKNSAIKVLMILFPDYELKLDLKNNRLLFVKDGQEQESYINQNSFELFKRLLNRVVCYTGDTTDKYNPNGEMSKKIVEKLKERERKLAEIRKNSDDDKEISILGQYISILSVGQQRSVNSYKDYTVYQIIYEFNRYLAKYEWDAVRTARLAGAQDIQDVDNWMGDTFRP